MTDELVDSKTDINNIMDLIIKSVDHIFDVGDKELYYWWSKNSCTDRGKQKET